MEMQRCVATTGSLFGDDRRTDRAAVQGETGVTSPLNGAHNVKLRVFLKRDFHRTEGLLSRRLKYSTLWNVDACA